MGALSMFVRTQCNACGHPVPVNALVGTVTCATCSAPVTVDWGRAWNALVVTGGRLQIGVGPGSMYLEHEPARPTCAACGAEPPLEAALAGGGTVACACGQPFAVRPFPRGPALGCDHAKLALATHLLGEDPHLLAAAAGAAISAPKRAEPVLFPCPGCGAPLPVDGSARVVACTFCRASAYLPDDLWRTLHPVVTSRRWYILFPHVTERARALGPTGSLALGEMKRFGEVFAQHRAAGRGLVDALHAAADETLPGAAEPRALANAVAHLALGFQADTSADVSRDGTVITRLLEAYVKAVHQARATGSTEINLPYLGATPNGPVHLARTLDVDDLARMASGPPAEQPAPEVEPPKKKKKGWFW